MNEKEVQMSLGYGFKKDTEDPQVHHPPHYNQGGVEAIQGIESALGPEAFVDYCRGAAIKYLWRCRYKGHTTQDLEKARWYIDRALSVKAGG